MLTSLLLITKLVDNHEYRYKQKEQEDYRIQLMRNRPHFHKVDSTAINMAYGARRIHNSNSVDNRISLENVGFFYASLAYD